MFVSMNSESVLFYQEEKLELQMTLQLKGQVASQSATNKPCHRAELLCDVWTDGSLTPDKT